MFPSPFHLMLQPNYKIYDHPFYFWTWVLWYLFLTQFDCGQRSPLEKYDYWVWTWWRVWFSTTVWQKHIPNSPNAPFFLSYCTPQLSALGICEEAFSFYWNCDHREGYPKCTRQKYPFEQGHPHRHIFCLCWWLEWRNRWSTLQWPHCSNSTQPHTWLNSQHEPQPSPRDSPSSAFGCGVEGLSSKKWPLSIVWNESFSFQQDPFSTGFPSVRNFMSSLNRPCSSSKSSLKHSRASDKLAGALSSGRQNHFDWKLAAHMLCLKWNIRISWNVFWSFTLHERMIIHLSDSQSFGWINNQYLSDEIFCTFWNINGRLNKKRNTGKPYSQFLIRLYVIFN